MCQCYEYPKDPLAPSSGDFLFGQAYAVSDPMQPYAYPAPLAAVASSLVGWDGNGQWNKEDMDSATPKPVLQPAPDFIFTNPFLSLAPLDVNVGCTDMPFGLDALSFQSDMDAYRMGLREYGITPASNQ